MNASVLTCDNCGTASAIATCGSCGQSFVIALLPQLRELEALPQQQVCDFCTAKAGGKLAQAIEAGLRQRTCPACHTEFLTQHER